MSDAAGQKHPTFERVAPLLLAVAATLTYALTAIAISQTRLFWVDETLAVWTARLPGVREIVAAIWNGAEFSPPTYDLILHAVFQTAGSDVLTARLPSIVAVLLAAGMIGIIVAKRLGPLFGSLAFALILNSALFDYAIQARAYALLSTLTAAGVTLWIARDGSVALRAAGVGFVLFASVALHFYAAIGYAVFALMELLRSLAFRRVRPAMWIGFATSGLACAVWLPLIRRHAAFNADDARSPDFYGAPTLSRLAEHMQALFVGAGAFWLFILAAMLALASAYAVARARVGDAETPAAGREEVRDLTIVGACLLAALPIGFGLALTVTHVFSARYALAATIGAAILFTLAVARSPFRNQIAYALLAVLCVLPLVRAGPGDLSAAATGLLNAHPTEGPIVIGDGNFFMEMVEAAAPSVRTRLVYLKRPAGVIDGDTSAQQQLLRLKNSFRPDLAVRDFDEFTRENRAFVLLARPGRATDALSNWLVANGWVTGVSSLHPAIALMRARAP